MSYPKHAYEWMPRGVQPMEYPRRSLRAALSPFGLGRILRPIGSRINRYRKGGEL